MTSFDTTGWLIRDKGLHYLATSRGWFTLEGVPSGSGNERPARVQGTLIGDLVVQVADIQLGQAPPKSEMRRPAHIVAGRTELHRGSELRLAAIQWLAERGYAHVTLPHVWFRTEEYGAREFRLEHPSSDGTHDLRLLQSPELPLYYALAEGLEPCFTFGRCYRHEVVHDPDRDGSYLMEFEQLVVGASLTSLEEMMKISEALVKFLASQVGVGLEDVDFRRVDGIPPSGSELPHIDDLRFLTIPSTWPPSARAALLDRLRLVDATLFLMDADGPVSIAPEVPSESIRPGLEVRLGVLPAADDEGRTSRILDIASSMAGSSEDVGRVVALQWNPTWSLHPSLEWTQDEQSDSELPVRSFTSARVETTDGRTVLQDAELHLGGVEIVHVREYAQVSDLVTQAASAGAGAELAYLKDSDSVAPPGMVGLFIGWERIVSVLLGLNGADRSILYPRRGDGTLPPVR